MTNQSEQQSLSDDELLKAIALREELKQQVNHTHKMAYLFNETGKSVQELENLLNELARKALFLTTNYPRPTDREGYIFSNQLTTLCRRILNKV